MKKVIFRTEGLVERMIVAVDAVLSGRTAEEKGLEINSGLPGLFIS